MQSSIYCEKKSFCHHPISKKLCDIIKSKKTNLALACDVKHKEELVTYAKMLGPYIAVLKTHMDILQDFDEGVLEELKMLSQKYHFLLFEDRKFCDIGKTVSMQYRDSIFKISQYFDIVNATIFAGISTIEGLKEEILLQEKGLLLLAQMSTQGNFFDEKIVQQTQMIAQKYKDFVIGVVAQNRILEDPCFFHFMPGIHFSKRQDGLKQGYHTPECAILERGADILIVGRGILEATDPVTEAKLYQKMGWDTYLKR